MSTQKTLKDVIKEEYKKCLVDPIYFMKKYVKIQHPIRGTVNFDLYEFQEKTLTDLVEHDFNIILKSRQMGISTLTAAYSLWLMVFHKDKNVLCISINQETSKEIVTRVRFANDNLPSWLKVKEQEDNRLSLRLTNGSQIKAVSSAGTSGRSSALSLLIIDEAAFIDNIAEIWLSAQYTLSTGGRAIMLSTPNGVGNFFHQTWIKAEAKENEFNTIRLPWHLHPERDQSWRDKQTELSGVKGAAQECDCDFATTGNGIVDAATIDFYKQSKVKDPIEMRGIDHGYWIWEYPDYSRNYIVSADVARGDGGDYSAFQVIDVESMTQVAEYKGQIGTKDYGNMLVTVATDYNNALLIVENANIGWAVLQQIIDRQYQNTFYSSADLQYVDVERQLTNKINRDEKKMIPGFTNSQKTRPLLISKLESYFRERSVEVRSLRFMDELAVFIWDGNKVAAMKGYNDDLVMAMSIGLWVRDTALKLRQQSMDLNRSMLGGITRIGGSQNVYKSQTVSSQEAWQMTTGKITDKKEDLTWLL
jgi:hypothetical protein|tara:strand:- start:28 stop:1623 length:1596 start_codon:yes stop_codon:yes gene_type:complete